MLSSRSIRARSLQFCRCYDVLAVVVLQSVKTSVTSVTLVLSVALSVKSSVKSLDSV